MCVYFLLKYLIDVDMIRRGTHKYFLKRKGTPTFHVTLSSSTEYIVTISVFIINFNVSTYTEIKLYIQKINVDLISSESVTTF